MKVPVLSITCIQTAIIFGACGGKEGTFCPDEKATNCHAGNRRGRSDQDGRQMARPEHKGMAAVSKFAPL